ncbi:MAG: hypothetical protein AAF990_26740 [Bacteroidota bacterium]
MANKENNQPSMPGMGELSTIRDILMGKQMNDYERQFSDISDRFKTMEGEFQSRLQQMEADYDKRVKEIEQEMLDRFEKLEKQLIDNVTNLDNKLRKTSKEDRNRLGKMLAKVSKQLLDE